MDLDATEKVVLEGRLKNKLLTYRRASDSQIEAMLRVASTAETEKKDEYINLMRDVQKRITAAEGPAFSSPTHP